MINFNSCGCVSLILCVMKWEAPFLHIKGWWWFREKALNGILSCQLNQLLLYATPFVLESMSDKLQLRAQMFGRHFLKTNIVSPSLQGKLIVYVANENTKQNLEFWKICVCYRVLDSCVIQTFLMRSVVLLKNNFSILCDGMGEHLEDLYMLTSIKLDIKEIC